LREEVKQPNSQYGEIISNCMKDGLLVPLEITINLLKNELEKSINTKFLVDGFPRELDQAKEFESLIGEPSHVLYFSCSEEVMLERLLERGKTSGRSDDNEESIQKRFVTFKETSLPVIDYYKEKGKVSEVIEGCNECLFSIYDYYVDFM
jgi:UMP-CMP kinase